MWVKKALQFALFLIFAAVALAQHSSYGPPGFSSGFKSSGFGGFRGGYQDGFQGNAFHGGYQSGGYKSAQQEAPQPFSFQYEVKDPQSGNDFGHHATSDGHKVSGQYTVLLPDGRRQIVKYYADDNGYKADVQYEGQAHSAGGYHQGGYQSGGFRGGYSSGGFGGFGGGFAGYNY